MTKAPLGGGATGANPTDRGKKGTKRSMLTDADGIPLSIVVAGANRHDSKLLADTFEAVPLDLPEPTQEMPQHLSLDKGYDYEFIREILDAWAYTSHIRSRGEEKQQKENTPHYQARRWVVADAARSVPIAGSINSGAFWSDGKRKSLIIWPYSNWPLSSLFTNKADFSDRI